MRKIIIAGLVAIGLSTSIQANNIEQTICYSYEGKGAFKMAILGDDVPLYGGQCNGRKLNEMNRDGWKLIQIVTGLDGAFGMVFTKEE